MASLLITGGTGLLGSTWSRLAAPDWDVHLTVHRRAPTVAGAHFHECDLTTPASERLIEAISPALVVQCAGVTNVEQCEADPAVAWQLNVEMPRRIAQACRRIGVPLVHISTDHIFDGTSPMLTEDALPAPLNAYARSKAEGERVVLDNLPSALVLRTNFFGYGPSYRPSFSDAILAALLRREPIRLFDDVYFTPLLMSSLIEAAHDLVGRGASGIFHAVGDERISKYGFGMRLAEVFGLDPSSICRDRLEDRTGLTVRPLDMSLSNAKITAILGHSLKGATEQLHQLATSVRPAENLEDRA